MRWQAVPALWSQACPDKHFQLVRFLLTFGPLCLSYGGHTWVSATHSTILYSSFLLIFQLMSNPQAQTAGGLTA
jgi:hypothetical protein